MLKLGGSLVTEKSGVEAIDEVQLATVARTIGENQPASLVLIHGAGSFGHPVAAEHGVTRTEATEDARAVAEIRETMNQLNEAIVDALIAADVPAISVQPCSMSWMDVSGSVCVDAGAIGTILEEGYVPVAHGDIVAWQEHGFAILSGDDLATALARAVDAERIGLCANVPGVLDEDGDVVRSIATYEEVSDLIEAPDGTDVTGGMATKVRAILDHAVPGAIFGADELGAFLAGEMPGTRIAGDAVSF